MKVYESLFHNSLGLFMLRFSAWVHSTPAAGLKPVTRSSPVHKLTATMQLKLTKTYLFLKHIFPTFEKLQYLKLLQYEVKFRLNLCRFSTDCRFSYFCN